MSQRQGGGGICTKNGSYCEKEKKVGDVGGQGRCEQRSEAFRDSKKKKKNFFFFFFFFFLGGGGGGGGGGRVEGGVRVDVN